MGDFVSRQRNTQVSLCVQHVCLGQLSVVNQGLCCVGVHMVWRYTRVRVRLCVLCVFVCVWVCSVCTTVWSIGFSIIRNKNFVIYNSY